MKKTLENTYRVAASKPVISQLERGLKDSVVINPTPKEHNEFYRHQYQYIDFIGEDNNLVGYLVIDIVRPFGYMLRVHGEYISQSINN